MKQESYLLEWLRWWATLLDSRFRVPGTRIRFGIDPILWGVTASALAGIAISYMTSPPKQETIERCFAPQA